MDQAFARATRRRQRRRRRHTGIASERAVLLATGRRMARLGVEESEL
jgi:hypothetical protein